MKVRERGESHSASVLALESAERAGESEIERAEHASSHRDDNALRQLARRAGAARFAGPHHAGPTPASESVGCRAPLEIEPAA